ncbi:hypothetical protein [Kaarinaea lacus]
MRLNKSLMTVLVLLSFVAMDAGAKDDPEAKEKNEAKELSGISIVGNKEAPKSLFIVPWKSSELGVETGLASKLLDEKMKVVDKDVFERELDFYSSTVNE